MVKVEEGVVAKGFTRTAADYDEAVRVCGPEGFGYTFTKLFAVARRPQEST